jgi:DinB superfamily
VTLPVALQRIAAELEGARSQVLSETNDVSQDQADWHPAGGEWSIADTLEHLAKAEAIACKVVSVTLRRATADGITRPYPSELLEYPWTPPTAPDERWLVPVPELAAPAAGGPIDVLRTTLQEQAPRTFHVLEQLTAIDSRAHMAPHPILGDMDLAQWLRFCAYHLTVHWRQIRELKTNEGFPRR